MAPRHAMPTEMNSDPPTPDPVETVLAAASFSTSPPSAKNQTSSVVAHVRLADINTFQRRREIDHQERDRPRSELKLTAHQINFNHKSYFLLPPRCLKLSGHS
jgi:hypothetical protein